MKLLSRRILGLISVAAVVASACTSITKVEVVSWWTTGDRAHGFNAVIDQFNKDNPSLQVANSAVAGGSGAAAQSALLNRVLDNVPPDTFQVPMGRTLLATYVAPGLMDNLDDLYAANGWKNEFPQGVLSIVSAKDSAGALHYFSVPVSVHRANLLWFNKTVFAANNLTPPATWDQFFTVAEALKAKGLTPLAVGDRDMLSSAQLLETVLMGSLGADGYDGLWTGSTDWAGGTVKAALTTYQKVLTYTNSDRASLTWDQAADYLIPTADTPAKAAMTITADWAVGEFGARNFTDYGWNAAPGNDKIFDAYADSFGLPARAPNKAAARKFLTFLGSAAGQDLLDPWLGSIPANTTAGAPPADAKPYSPFQAWAIGEWKADAIVPSLEFDAAAGPGWKSAFETAVAAFVAKPDVPVLQGALAKACKDAGACR